MLKISGPNEYMLLFEGDLQAKFYDCETVNSIHVFMRNGDEYLFRCVLDNEGSFERVPPTEVLTISVVRGVEVLTVHGEVASVVINEAWKLT